MDEDNAKSIELKEAIEALYDYNTIVTPHGKEKVIEDLVKIGKPAIGHLINALGNAHGEVKNRIHQELRELGEGPKVVLLLDSSTELDVSYRNIKEQQLSEKFEPWVSSVRCCAAYALGKIGDPKVIEFLIKTLDDEDGKVSANAAFALGEIGDIRAAECLIKVLEQDKRYNVRANAAWALGNIGDTRAIEPLVRGLSSVDPELREECAEALGNICHLVTTVAFGNIPRKDLSALFYNPDVSELTSSLDNLNKIIIDTITYDFRKVERFITYAVNYIGKEYLKNNVEVHIYGDPEKLHQNLRNLFNSLCKKVEVYEGDNL